MISSEALQMPEEPKPVEPVEPASSPRISFSADFLDESDFISISPSGARVDEAGPGREKPRPNQDHNFEFLSDHTGGRAAMLTADELFFEGKLLPFRAMQQVEKLSRINLKSGEEGGGGVREEGERESGGEGVGRTGKEPLAAALGPPRPISWSFLDDDPSPRPPKCTVLWKELLRLKKHQKHQRPNFSSSLSPSSSSSSNSSSSSSMADAAAMDEKKKKKTTKKDGDAGPTARTNNNNNNDTDTVSHLKRIKKGLERTRSGSIRIRPMVNVPICTPVSRAGSGAGSTALPPWFPVKKGRI